MNSGRIAVIPARGGSKRVPRKNLRPFAGRPMIGYAIGVAQRSGLFERIVVSTDDAEVAAVARTLGADVPFLRPAELADDFTPTVPVIAHAIRACAELGWHARLACCIYPAVPLLQPQTLADALALLEAGDAPYAFPVLAYRAPIQRALKRDPRLAGSVTLEIGIGPAGQVSATKVSQDTLQNREVTECLRREAAGWLFHQARNVTIVYPFVFRAP